MMSLNITTWNVNGIRNPFQYQPWQSTKTFEAMFEILEADIVIFQETKIQRKDLRDDMVLVQGWDCHWSLPRHKKGYSGVVIYTRQSVCAPIRAEEGITGVLRPPKSSKSFSDQPDILQIGGYPTPTQLANSAIDAATIDSEGRCVILEFPAFVLLGVYSPANRDESRDDFRLGFLDLLDARVRNLIAMGKRVVLAGDLNISREELDTANAEASMRKNCMTGDEYISTPSRRLFNQLLEGGKVLGERDEGRDKQVMWDICRGFHPTRKGMFTCWEQKTNARPGNYGSRIDYVLCSVGMKDWFSSSNIQEGLMGSDHCPVYATLKNRVQIDGREVDLLDVMNPVGMFLHGVRQRQYSRKDILPLSGKLIPEFDGRRSIRDMFSRKPSLPQAQSTETSFVEAELDKVFPSSEQSFTMEESSQIPSIAASQRATLTSNSTKSVPLSSKKRALETTTNTQPSKRSKPMSSTTVPAQNLKGQQSLQGFFRPKAVSASNINLPSPRRKTEPSEGGFDRSAYGQDLQCSAEKTERANTPNLDSQTSSPISSLTPRQLPTKELKGLISSPESSPPRVSRDICQSKDKVADPIESKKSWSKLFARPAKPLCEGHSEPCISLQTKKSGMNCGRSFWMCPRPLGPTGEKERKTQWRCQTFIWCSDWDAISTRESLLKDSDATSPAVPS